MAAIKKPDQKSKEEMRRETAEAVQKWHGEVKSLPTRVPIHIQRDCDRNRTKLPSSFNALEESARLARAAAVQKQHNQEYQGKKLRGELPKEMTYSEYCSQVPWEE